MSSKKPMPTEMSVANASQYLQVLKVIKLSRDKKEGKFYQVSLADELPGNRI
jgi:hypothetical protein